MRKYILPKGATSPDALTIVETDTPKPGRGQVLIRVRACSLNFRDQIIASGRYFGPVAEDLTPLSDGTGEVVETGAEVSGFKQGDRVAGLFHQNWIDGPVTANRGSALGGPGCGGMLSEYVVLPESGVVSIAASLKYEQAATLPCAGVTAWNALMESARPVGPSAEVLVLGTGGVAMIALQIAKAAGARVVVTSSSDEKLARALSLGANAGVNYGAIKEWGRAAAALTRSGGFSHIVEVGGVGTLGQSMTALGYDGEISFIGLLSNDAFDASLLPLAAKGGVLRGISVGSRAMAERLNAAIDTNNLKPVIDRVFEFADAKEAFRYQASRSLFGKVVVRL
jgi:NADPH:quinone reductase-like Zn-dependent oxidoreductase